MNDYMSKINYWCDRAFEDLLMYHHVQTLTLHRCLSGEVENVMNQVGDKPNGMTMLHLVTMSDAVAFDIFNQIQYHCQEVEDIIRKIRCATSPHHIQIYRSSLVSKYQVMRSLDVSKMVADKFAHCM